MTSQQEQQTQCHTWAYMFIMKSRSSENYFAESSVSSNTERLSGGAEVAEVVEEELLYVRPYMFELDIS